MKGAANVNRTDTTHQPKQSTKPPSRWWERKPKEPRLPADLTKDPIGWIRRAAEKHGIILDRLAAEAFGAAFAGMYPYLQGPAGQGKSAMIQTIAMVLQKELEQHNIDAYYLQLNVAAAMPYEVAGIKAVDHKTNSVIDVPPDWLRPAYDGKLVIAILDEIGTNSLAEGPFRMMLTSRVVADGVPIPRHVLFFLAGNPPSQNMGLQMSPPFQNRLVEIQVTADPTEWARSFDPYWGMDQYVAHNFLVDPKVFLPKWRSTRSIISAFILVNTSALNTWSEGISGPFATPRSFDYFSRILAVLDLLTTEAIADNWDVVEKYALGTIGSEATHAFHNWVRQATANLDMDAILNGNIPQSVQRLDVAYLAAAQLRAYAYGAKNPDDIKKALRALDWIIARSGAADAFAMMVLDMLKMAAMAGVPLSEFTDLLNQYKEAAKLVGAIK